MRSAATGTMSPLFWFGDHTDQSAPLFAIRSGCCNGLAGLQVSGNAVGSTHRPGEESPASRTTRFGEDPPYSATQHSVQTDNEWPKTRYDEAKRAPVQSPLIQHVPHCTCCFQPAASENDHNRLFWQPTTSSCYPISRRSQRCGWFHEQALPPQQPSRFDPQWFRHRFWPTTTHSKRLE